MLCNNRSGIHPIRLAKYSNDYFLVECDARTLGGQWTLIQRRQDGTVDFYRTWDEYVLGFGRIEGEFFIGLEKLYALTHYDGPQELLVVLRHNQKTRYAKYSNFVIGNADENYALKALGEYSGDAGDSLRYHLKSKFTTKDRDYDSNHTFNCAGRYMGAWWYKNCHRR